MTSARHLDARPLRRRRRLAVVGAALLAVGLIAFGAWTLWDRHDATAGQARLADAPPSALDEFDEREVPLSECRADDADAKILTLDPFDVAGCVQPVGRDAQNRMEAPGNITVAGWFDESARPGRPGLTVIDGHASGRFRDGLFNRLGDLEPGSTVSIERGDGTVHTYEVTSVRVHPVADTMTNLYADAEREGSDLAMYTCDGAFDTARNTFEDRLVVLAKEIRTTEAEADDSLAGATQSQ